MAKTKKPPTFGEKQQSKIKKQIKDINGEIARILSAHETSSVMLEEHDVYVRGIYDRENKKVTQVFLDSGVVTIKTEDGDSVLASGEYYLEDIAGVLIGLEKAISPAMAKLSKVNR